MYSEPQWRWEGRDENYEAAFDLKESQIVQQISSYLLISFLTSAIIVLAIE